MVTLLLIPTLGWSQLSAEKEKEATSDYYQFPIRTGNQNFLSGTMGELRRNHFHAGIDIKTQGVQGLEVYAAADGYVSRIKVSTGGYGNALYILHRNGTTSVYAHLQKYNSEIAEFVRKAQYSKKSFEIELFPEKNRFQIKKGDIVGFSGNSGSSAGPHLHFEIRDSQQKPLNPLKFGFPEIRDNIPPEVRKIALRTMDKNSRINHRYGRFEFQVVRQGSNYILPVPIAAYGNIGVEILTHDKLNGANNRNGVPYMELTLNQQQVFQQKLRTFSFAESRCILIHTDYQTAQQKSQRFVKMYVDNGNSLPFYKTSESRGILSIEADSLHKVQINLWDKHNNSRQVVFEIQGEFPKERIQLQNYKNASALDYQLKGNSLVIKAPGKQDNPCSYVFSRRMRYQLDAAYHINNTAVFLWDMHRGLPDSIQYSGQTLNFGYKAVMPGASSFNYYGETVDIHAPVNALFDTVYLTYTHAVDTVKNRERFTICEDIYPIRKNISIALKPELSYPDHKRTAVYALDKRNNPSYVGGKWDGRIINFKTRNWGTYTILSDTLKPVVKPLILNKDQLVFRIDDKLSGIHQYELHLDGQWVLMNYDYKKKIIRSEKLDSNQPFSGRLELKVTDNAGNINLYRTNI